MAVADNALCTLTGVKLELGLTVATHDAVLERLINVASDAIASYCGRPLHYTASLTEKVPGRGGQILLVTRTPIVTLTSIKLYATSVATTSTTLESSTYRIKDAAVGSIAFPGGVVWSAPHVPGAIEPALLPGAEDLVYEVAYNGGWVSPAQAGTRTLPYDIEQCALDSVVATWRRRGQYTGLQTESEAQDEAPLSGLLLPKAVLATLQRYRRLS